MELRKALYRLRSASLAWYRMLADMVESLGLKACETERRLFSQGGSDLRVLLLQKLCPINQNPKPLNPRKENARTPKSAHFSMGCTSGSDASRNRCIPIRSICGVATYAPPQ